MTALLRCLAQRFAGPTARKLAKQARLSPGQARKTAVWHGNQFLANSMSLVVGLSLTGRSFAVQRNAVEHQEYPDTGNDTKPRNIILPVDNSEDSDYAVSWTLDNIYKAGDKMHFLHCIPRQPGSSAFKTGDPGSLPVAVDSMGSFHEAIRQRHRLTLDAVRKKFEAKLLKCNVPQEDLVYDILEESLPPQYMSTYFGVRHHPL